MQTSIMVLARRSAALGLGLGFATATPTFGEPPADLLLRSLEIGVTSPVAVRAAGDGSDRLFVVERSGIIRVFSPSSGLVGTPFLDITSDVDASSEGGLLGLAFHPGFNDNRYFYLHYTRSGEGSDVLTTVIERFSVSASDPDQGDLGSRTEILTLGQPAGNHNGGDLHFGPDGFLYIGLGDGGASSFTSQDAEDLLGSMLRVDPCDTPTCSPPYTVPIDNPFVGTTGRDEIWSIGFRNPYRWSFDRTTGHMLIADVGASLREEVSLERVTSAGGLNYGWNCREGDIAGPGGCTGTFVEPIIVYPHGSGNCSIIGGFRYSGCIEGLRGRYVFSDFCSARIWFGEEMSPGQWSVTEWADLAGNVYGFGEDEDGELYVVQGGDVLRFESGSDCIVIHADGFESMSMWTWTEAVP